jgi:hypothetical protein
MWPPTGDRKANFEGNETLTLALLLSTMLVFWFGVVTGY